MWEKINTFMHSTIFKFAVVGVVNTIVGLVAMLVSIVVLEWGKWFSGTVNYWVSSATNIVVGSIVSYILNKHFTFQSNTKAQKDVFRFVVNAIVCYIIAYGVARPVALHFVVGAVQMVKQIVALLFGAVLFTILNYFGQRFYVFKED